MDALALLCTLHADGPATWRRLREEGCHSLAELEALDNARLAGLLGSTPAVARRFVREARNLSERMGAGGLDREESFGATPVRPQVASAEQIAGLARAGAPAAEPRPAPGAQGMTRTALGPNDQRLLAKVLSSWREHDASTGVPAEPQPPTACAPEEAARAPSFALAPGLVDGLDEKLCEFLHAESIHTLEDLARIDATSLSQHFSVGYTRLARIRSLARRKLEFAGVHVPQRPLARAVREPHERFSAAEQPAATPELPDLLIPRMSPHAALEKKYRAPNEITQEPEGAAGPFARG